MGRIKLPPTGPQILLAENDELLCEVVGEALQRQGLSFATARTGDEAIAMAYRLRPQIVLVDTHMPGQSGYLVAAKLTLAHPRPAVLIVTSSPRGQSDRLAEFVRADAMLHKPFAITKLLATLDGLLQRTHAHAG